jgi:hypothetical protein
LSVLLAYFGTFCLKNKLFNHSELKDFWQESSVEDLTSRIKEMWALSILTPNPCHLSGSSCFSLASFAPEQKDEAATIEKGEKKISQDDRQLIDVERIDQSDHAPPEAEVPKDIWHDQLLSLLRIEPLDDES